MARKEVERRCLVTGEVKDKSELIRFVLDDEKNLVVDLAEKLPGRGFWVTAHKAMIQKAVKAKSFHRAAKEKVEVSPILVDEVARLLRKRALDHLGLVRRAGALALGYDQVVEAIAKSGIGSAPKVIALISARDASLDGIRKIGGKARKLEEKWQWVRFFTVDELSLALGRENVVHGALFNGAVGENFLRESSRLAGFVDEQPVDEAEFDGDVPGHAQGQQVPDQ